MYMDPPTKRVLALWVSLLLGCSSGPSARGAPESAGSARPVNAEVVVWQSPLEREHPLAGKIWDVERERFVERSALIAQIRSAQLVLLGEQHDNADHHQLQAWLLQGLIDHGRRPALVLEMLNVEQQPSVDQALAARAGADAFARAVDWEHSGWPAFALYRPLFERALHAELALVAAGIDRKVAMGIARGGTGALDPALVERFALNDALSPEVAEHARKEMADAHCGLLPASMLDTMVLVQRARDARLAERMHASGANGGAVLIAGAGHVRNDRGVPAELARAYGAASLALGLLEVETGVHAPAAYAAHFDAPRLPFAFVWFTPRASDTDHCAELRASMQHGASPGENR